jgi:hypothetical protein
VQRGDVTETQPTREPGGVLAQEPHMSPGRALRWVVRALVDGTGRSQQEVWVLIAATVAVTVSAAAVRGAIRVVDFATQQ